MSFKPILYSKPGQIEALPVILLSDHLGINIDLKKHECLPEKCICTSQQTCLQVADNDCVVNTAAQLRYLARSATSSLYDESDSNIVQIDQRLDSCSNTLKELTTLAEFCRGNSKLASKEEALVRRNLTQGLKDLDNLFKSNEKLPFNLSDILLFSTLGCLIDANTTKTVKGLKALK